MQIMRWVYDRADRLRVGTVQDEKIITRLTDYGLLLNYRVSIMG